MSEHWITPDWPAPSNIKAVSTLRTGGVSSGRYADFNLAQHVHDNQAHVRRNRLRLQKMLHLPAEPQWLQQVHGNQVVEHLTPTATTYCADASFTRASGVVCTVLTADCLPLLICDTEGRELAAVHAGWRGLQAGVIESTLAKFTRRPLMAWMGPAIGPEAFEVGDDVRNGFSESDARFAEAFVSQHKGKWMADIYALARYILERSKIEQIYGGQYCTYSDAERFFSYRRAGLTGRMATLIWKSKT